MPKSLPRGTLCLAALLLATSVVQAQAPPVPPEYQDLYTSLDNYLTAFNTTLTPNTGYPVLFCGDLKNANGNVGPQLVNPSTFVGIQLQIQEIKAMGAQAIMIEVGFPLLYEPFLTSQGQSYDQFVAFYQQVAAAVRAAGLKLIVENDTLLTNDVQAGWNATPFYATLDWTAYQAARAQNAVTVARTLQPDYFVAVEEPSTESINTGQSDADTPDGSAAMLSQILTSLQQAGVPGMLTGAGTTTAQQNFLSFIQDYVALPVDFIDMHIYPINRSYLPNALQIAATAAAAGKPVTMSECWMWKVRDSELSTLPPDEVRARDPFSFWAPLDAYFLQTMENLGYSTQMLFMAPMGTEYFAAYLDYYSVESLSPSQILGQEDSQAAQNMQGAVFSSTAMSYYASLVTPPDTIPPGVPAGLSGSSANPTTATLTWTGASDNVGVAGYYVLRNGSIVAGTANTYFQDSGLVEATTYTYTLEAFDLAGNISTPSAPVNVTTADVTPPTPPASLTATAASCERVKLTWSASTDANGIREYLVFWGLSPGALIQAGVTKSTVTSFTSYPLTAGTTYYYGVEAIDNSGNISLMSTVVSIATPQPPSPPAGLSATPTSATTIALSWQTAAGGGLPVGSYRVLQGTSQTGLTQVAVTGRTTYTNSSLNPSATYYYAVEAVDTGGDVSGMTAVISAATPGLPSAPTDLIAKPGSTSRLTLTWAPAVSGGLPIQNYRIYRGDSATTLSQVATVVNTTYKDFSALAGATYYYTVTAADTARDVSPMSAPVAAVMPVPPSPPSNLLASAVSVTNIKLSWSAAASGGLPVASYLVYRARRGAGFTQIASVHQTTFTDCSGTPSATYYYAIQAEDSGGDLSAMSRVVRAKTLALPAAPVDLAATLVTKGHVTLTWAPGPVGMPLSTYTINRGSTPDTLAPLRTIPATSATFTDYSVAAGATYYYAVQATDTGRNISPMSAVLQVVTPQ